MANYNHISLTKVATILKSNKDYVKLKTPLTTHIATLLARGNSDAR